MQNDELSLFGLQLGVQTGKLAAAILDCADTAAEQGLVLTEQTARALAVTTAETLRETGRIELGEGIGPSLFRAFCSSPYLSARNLEETMQALIALFYQMKNDTEDRVSDADLVAFLKDAFDGDCRGELTLLADAAEAFCAAKRREG